MRTSWTQQPLSLALDSVGRREVTGNALRAEAFGHTLSRWPTNRLSRAIFRTPAAVKVPAIGPLFWVIKILSTGMGEACSDFLAAVSIPLAVGVALVGMAVDSGSSSEPPSPTQGAIGSPWHGGGLRTRLADGVHLIGLPYLASTAFHVGVVVAMFALWRRSEGTLSGHSIFTTRREVFYWATVLATFALGTAAGDLVAGPLGPRARGRPRHRGADRGHSPTGRRPDLARRGTGGAEPPPNRHIRSIRAG